MKKANASLHLLSAYNVMPQLRSNGSIIAIIKQRKKTKPDNNL